MTNYRNRKTANEMTLGDRMKEYYENVYAGQKLPMRMPVIIRLDGKAFHTFTRGMKRPFDFDFMKLMNDTTEYLCRNIQNCVLGYVQSDEISLLIFNYKELNTSSWYDNKVQKMTSISAAMASAFFTKEYIKLNPSYDKPIMFDSRCFVLPVHEIANYFIWRQLDCQRNSIQQVAQSLYSPKELHGKSCKDLIPMIEEKTNEYPFNNSRDYYMGRTIQKCIDSDNNASFCIAYKHSEIAKTYIDVLICKKNTN